MRHMRKVMLAISFALLWATAALAQVTTGSINGVVQDADGAVIPNAKVTLTQQSTKSVRKVTSNGEGVFVFPSLTTGVYDIQVTAAGFKSWAAKGVNIEPGDKKTVPAIRLEVGKTDEIVNVEASALEVQIVNSGDRAATLSQNEIKNMALLGRDVTDLVKTLPGFSTFTDNGGVRNVPGYSSQNTSIGSAVGNGYSAQGTPNRSGATDLISDGARILDVGCNCNATATVNGDMVNEVKVSTSTFSADSSKGPVVVQAVGKSGSTMYHGMAYLHFRDSSMNSNDWNVKYNGLKRPDTRYWYPGGQIGGPIRIPGTDFNKNNKLLFFAGYEYYHQIFPDGTSAGGLLQAVVPTDDMMNGNFNSSAASNVALCKLSSSPSSCGSIGKAGDTITVGAHNYTVTQDNMLPAGSISSDMYKYMKAMIPSANHTPTSLTPYNYVKTQMKSDNGWMFHSRVDYNISEADKLYFALNLQRDTGDVPIMLWWAPSQSVPFAGGQQGVGKSQTYSANYVHIFNASTTNELQATLTHYKAAQVYSHFDKVSRAALGVSIPSLFGQSKVLPSLSNGWWISGYPMSFQADDNNTNQVKYTPSINDSVTKTTGNHTFKAGGSFERADNTSDNFSVNNAGINGVWQFGTWGSTGNPVANMLLGSPTDYAETNKIIRTEMGYWSMGFFAQDDWKLSKRLTLTYGLRVTHDSPWTDLTGKTGLAVWKPADYATDVANNRKFPGLRWHATDSSIPVSGRTVNSLFYQPRMGFSYDVFGTGRTLLRGGYGLYYYHDGVGVTGSALSTVMGQYSCDISLYQTGLAGIDPAKATGGACSNGYSGVSVVDGNDHKQPVTQTYSFTASQRLPFSSLLEVAYSGNQSTQLQLPNTNVNALPAYSVISKGGVVQVDPVMGSTPALLDLRNSKGGYNINDYRPYTAYGSNLGVMGHGAWANYNSMQVSLTRQRGSLLYNFNFTWSKTLGVRGASPDPIDIRHDYGYLNSDRSKVFNASISYEVGNVIKGNKLLGGLVNGWMISDIITIQGGAPLAESFSTNMGLGGVSNASINGTQYDFKNFTIDGLGVWGSPDFTAMPLVTCNPTAHLRKHQYYNPNCFGSPTMSNNGGYHIPLMRTPMYWNSDISLAKTFKITDRQNVQFKLSAFDFLNHPLWSFNSSNASNLNLQFRPATLGLADYSTYTGATSLTGSATGVPVEKFGARVVELTMKYNF